MRQGERGAGMKPVDVDAVLRTPRRSHANARLCRNARDCHGCVRQELAARMIVRPRWPAKSA